MDEQRPSASAEILEADRRQDPGVPCLGRDEHVHGNRGLRPVKAPMQAKDERADHVTSHPGKLASRGRTNACQHEYVRRFVGEVGTRRKARSLSARRLR